MSPEVPTGLNLTLQGSVRYSQPRALEGLTGNHWYSCLVEMFRNPWRYRMQHFWQINDACWWVERKSHSCLFYLRNNLSSTQRKQRATDVHNIFCNVYNKKYVHVWNTVMSLSVIASLSLFGLCCLRYRRGQSWWGFTAVKRERRLKLAPVALV